MVRDYCISDLDAVMEIWLSGNLDAHPFVDQEYWKSHYSAVREEISTAELLVFEDHGQIQGFLGLVDCSVAGLFVRREFRSMGIGKALLDAAKQRHPQLTLHVYGENSSAFQFYLREGFEVLDTALDRDTGFWEYTMEFPSTRPSE